jgi:hypothetical protein
MRKEGWSSTFDRFLHSWILSKLLIRANVLCMNASPSFLTFLRTHERMKLFRQPRGVVVLQMTASENENNEVRSLGSLV